MARTVFLEGKRVRVTDAQLIGQGGEAHVYAHPPLALKVYDALSAPSAALSSLRERKVRALAGTPLPPHVVSPTAPLLDDTGAFVGYAMKRVDALGDIALLARPTRPLDANAVLAVFTQLADTVAQVHAAGCVVGDLNDGNALLTRDASGHAAVLIDTDSWQIACLPCPVAHERFLDPHLYGADLLARACFTPLTDAYALRVMLFASLVFVHPYGGVHAPKSGAGYKTMLRRAEAAWSVLRGDVQLPKCAAPLEVLPDDMLEDFTRAFDRGVREPFTPLAAKLKVPFVRCACGVEHARRSCPACKIAVQRPAFTVHGTVTAETLVETRGRIVAARMLAGHLCVACAEVDGMVREDRARVLEPTRATVAVALAVERTWIERDGVLACVQQGALVDRAHATEFAITRAGLFLVEGDALVHHETRTRRASVIGGRTKLFAGDDAVIALYRVGRALRGVRVAPVASFGAHVGARSTSHDLELGVIAGKIVDIAIAFDADDGRALVGIAHDDGGRRVHTLVLLDAHGNELGRASGAPESGPHLHAMRGHALAHKKILAPSDDGVCVIDIDRGALVAGAVFADTRAFVDSTVALLPGGNGSIVVVSTQSVTRLRLS